MNGLSLENINLETLISSIILVLPIFRWLWKRYKEVSEKNAEQQIRIDAQAKINSELQADVFEVKQKNRELETDLKIEQNKRLEAESKKDESDSKFDKLFDRVLAIESKSNAQEVTINTLEAEINAWIIKHAEQAKQLIELQEQYADLQDKYADQQTVINTLQVINDEQKKLLNQKEQVILKQDGEIAEYFIKETKLSKDLAAAQEENERMVEEMRQLEDKIAKLQKSLAELTDKVTVLASRVDTQTLPVIDKNETDKE